jgi:hypothetical protein
MRDHRAIDERSLALAQEIAARIDADPARRGLDRARGICARWRGMHTLAVLDEWEEILRRPWSEVRRVLLDMSEEGARLRQSSPFCGVLTARERWAVHRRYTRRDAGAA